MDWPHVLSVDLTSYSLWIKNLVLAFRLLSDYAARQHRKSSHGRLEAIHADANNENDSVDLEDSKDEEEEGCDTSAAWFAEDDPDSAVDVSNFDKPLYEIPTSSGHQQPSSED